MENSSAASMSKIYVASSGFYVVGRESFSDITLKEAKRLFCRDNYEHLCLSLNSIKTFTSEENENSQRKLFSQHIS